MKLAHTCNIRPIKLRALLSSLLLLTGVATQSPAQNLGRVDKPVDGGIAN